jgi:hypothetical protein
VNDLRTSRRQVLVGAGAALAGGVLLSRSTDTAPGGTAAEEVGATIILQDPRHALPDAVQRRLAGNGARLVHLEADPVRQWRGDSAALLAARATRLLGVTRWPEFLLVRGLAEESGRRVRYQRFNAARGVMVWLIA